MELFVYPDPKILLERQENCFILSFKLPIFRIVSELVLEEPCFMICISHT